MSNSPFSHQYLGYSQQSSSSQQSSGVPSLFMGYSQSQLPPTNPQYSSSFQAPQPVLRSQINPNLAGNKRPAETLVALSSDPTVMVPMAPVGSEEQIALSTSGAGIELMPLEYQGTLQSLMVHWVTETLDFGNGVQETVEANMGIGSIFLAQTFPWRGQPWNTPDQVLMNWAVCRVESIDFGGGAFSFYVAKHMSPFFENRLDVFFSRAGEVYSSDCLLTETLVFRPPAEARQRQGLGLPPQGLISSPRLSATEYARFIKASTVQMETKRGPRLNPGMSSLADIFHETPPHEGTSYSSKDDFKIVYDYQGNQHTIRSLYAVKFLSFMNLYYRVMEDRKRDVIIRADTAYDRESWDGAMDLFRLGEATVGMEAPIATLYECFKLDNMPIMLCAEKLDRARLCVWKARDLTWLSITDFHEAPHGVQNVLKGTDRSTRMYLSGCVKGYLVFLKVYFFSQADTLLTRLISWLEKPDSPYTKPVNSEFVRCRIDRMFVDMWTEVRSSFNGSSRFPGMGDFQTPGAVWILLGYYEQSLFEQMALDEYPHTRFYEKPRGEFYTIRGGGLVDGSHPQTVMSPSRAYQSGGGTTTHPSPPLLPSPSRGGGGKVMVICPYHLARQLAVARNDGTLMSECSYASNCRFPHVDIATITAPQALGTLHNCKPSMTEKVTSAITLRGADFKA